MRGATRSACGSQRPQPGRRLQGSKKNVFCWVEISTPNLDAAVGYYRKLFGWKVSERSQDGVRFTEHEGQIGIGLMGGAMAQKEARRPDLLDVETWRRWPAH